MGKPIVCLKFANKFKLLKVEYSKDTLKNNLRNQYINKLRMDNS